jgi:hypothetical protein
MIACGITRISVFKTGHSKRIKIATIFKCKMQVAIQNAHGFYVCKIFIDALSVETIQIRFASQKITS